MKRRRNKTGVTLVEILVVVAVIAILISMVIGIAARIDTQGKEQLTKNTLALLDAALGEFGDYEYSYTDYPSFAGLKYPPDCNNFDTSDFATELGWTIGGPGTHDANYSGSEVMYFFLSKVPESRTILDKIDTKLVTNLDIDGDPIEITVGSGPGAKVYELFRVIDPWGESLRYSYYDNTLENTTSEPRRVPLGPGPKTFPIVTSAGADKTFGTDDDIESE
ncbi:MAG: type II secretion system protein [Phycisphaerae bacterium]|nr:type II secretion system protein [Phycisphaerae bacterium]MDD5381629.1 type II secretion system protein [Phycisphaerae bacterium]